MTKFSALCGMVCPLVVPFGFGTISLIVSVDSFALFEMEVVPAGGMCGEQATLVTV